MILTVLSKFAFIYHKYSYHSACGSEGKEQKNI